MEVVIWENVIALMVTKGWIVQRACVQFCVQLTDITVVDFVTVKMAGKVWNVIFRPMNVRLPYALTMGGVLKVNVIASGAGKANLANKMTVWIRFALGTVHAFLENAIVKLVGKETTVGL